jgi:hypothetical protein
VTVGVGVIVGVTLGSGVFVGVGVAGGLGQLLTAYFTALAALTIAPVLVYFDNDVVFTPEDNIVVLIALIERVEHAD